MVAFTNNVTSMWRKVADIEAQLAEEVRRHRDRMERLQEDRDQLLVKIVDLDGIHDRASAVMR